MSQIFLVLVLGAFFWCLRLWARARQRVELNAIKACSRCKVTFVRGSLHLRALRWRDNEGRPALVQAYSFKFLGKDGRVGQGGAVTRGSRLVDMHLDLDVDDLKK